MNSELYGNTYPVPERIINKIRATLYNNPTGDGIKRAKNLVHSPNVTYQQLKRLKNFFDNYNPETTHSSQFELAGGVDMQNFVDQTLQNERSKTSSTEKNMRDVMAGDSKRDLNAQSGHVQLREEDDAANDTTNDAEDGGLTINAIVAMFDDEMRILILKRSSYPDQWMPNKFSLLGGGVEEGEEPIDGARREIKEETGIEVEKLMEKFVIQRGNNVEHLFICKLPEKHTNDDVTLNEENAGFLWMSVAEINNANKDLFVPNFFEYIKIAAEKYE